MARRRKRRRRGRPIAGLVVVEAVVVGALAWQHRIPLPYLAPGRAALMALPASLRAPLLRALPIEAVDLLPYLAGLIALAFLVRVMRGGRSRVRARNLGEMLALTPYQFEEYVAGLLRAQGYKGVRRVGGSGDFNADVTARDPEGRSVVVQCKRYAVGNRIGSPAIQTFIGMVHVHHKAERGIFVTTSSYTDDARALARQHGLTLWDGSDLTRMISRTSKGPPVAA